jgi:FAD/FMN-containing dehydrogenase/Fe-S oxidoreductase
MADLNTFIDSLKKEIKGEVLSDDYSLGIYATDASVYQILPVAVVLPREEKDVIKALKIAKEYAVSILPRGGGTSLAGQTVGHSMVLDFSKYMNQVLEFNLEERWVRVQPGIVYDVLNTYLKPHNLHFAPDPATSSRANIGGMIGNNSSGTKSILYGKTVDHVLEAKVVLADGHQLHLRSLTPEEYNEKSSVSGREGEIYKGFRSIIEHNRDEIERRFPKVMRRVGGYNLDEFIHTDKWNLCKLITGSEGTLATLVEVKLNLEPLPERKAVCVVHFKELISAIEAVEPILDFGPAAVEILDETVVELSRKNLTTQRSCHFIEGDPAAILIVEFYGKNEEEVLQKPRQMVAYLRKNGFGYAWPFYSEGRDYDDVWLIRKKGLGLMLGMKGKKKPTPFIEDAGIPVKVLPEYIDRVLKICKSHGTEVAMYAHASVGVIHVRPILDLRDGTDIKRFEKIARETFELVKKYEGSWSGEHGDGLVRSSFNEAFFGPQVYGALREVKRLFDSENLMNPGKIVEAPPMTENLRYGAAYNDKNLKTTFLFREDGSFGDAVHMCTGVGECRKILGGTMCPSYKATRDEEHSTRGRANALRMAMSGQLDHGGLAGERLRQVLDLCLSCKACKSECPSNVDMAKLKSEVSSTYHHQHGMTLRDRFIKNSASMASRLSGPGARIINPILGNVLFRRGMEKISGIDHNRIMPAYAVQPFKKWFRKNTVKNSGPTVALFADTYLNYHEPDIGMAAYELLVSCGYNVVLTEAGCCQRPKISHGFLEEAKTDGLKTAQGLDVYLSRNIPVLVCEPGCASSLTDDLPDLIEEEALASRLKKGVFMIDQFLDQEVKNKKIDVEFISSAERMMIHGHCHQKALYGTSAMKDLLKRVKDLDFMEVDSGCCGMAGSFGYEKEHYKLSEKIGSSVLFPAIRELDEKTTVVACGFSCRHQIKHFTGRKARHWVEVIQVKKNGIPG